MRALIPAREKPRPLPEPLAAAAATNTENPAVDAVDELAAGGQASAEAGDVGGRVGRGSGEEDGGEGAGWFRDDRKRRLRRLRHPFPSTPSSRRHRELGFRPLAAARSLALPDASIGIAFPIAVHGTTLMIAGSVAKPKASP